MKADELWEKYAGVSAVCVFRGDFEKALTEYGEHVKSEAVKVCKEEKVYATGPSHQRVRACNDCAAAIEKMPLP